jgi:hypothetical protein
MTVKDMKDALNLRVFAGEGNLGNVLKEVILLTF